MPPGELITIAGRRWRVAPDSDPGLAEDLIRRAMSAVERGEARNLKSGRRKRLFPLTLLGGAGPDHLLKAKEFRFLPGVLRRLRRCSARREFDLAFALARTGLPVALPLAVGEEHRTGRLFACYLLCPILDNVVDLRRLLADRSIGPAERRALVTAFGEFSRRIHDAGFHQDDFAPNNFLVRRGDPPAFLLIDFERARLERRLGPSRRRWMLAKLDRHVLGCRAAERMRFLRAYTRGNDEEARKLWLALEELSPRLAWRDFRRLRRVCAAENRRFRRVRENGLSGWAARDVSIPKDLPPNGQGGGVGRRRLYAESEGWVIDYGPMTESAGQELWALAHALWTRGALVPRPLFLLRRPGSVLLGLAREAGAEPLSGHQDPAALGGAVTVLLEHLMAVGEIDRSIGPDDIALAPSPGGALRATLIAPHLFRFRRTATRARDSRDRARVLLSALGPPASAGADPDPGIPERAAGDR